MSPAAEQSLYALDSLAGDSRGDRAKLLRAIASTLRRELAETAAAERRAAVDAVAALIKTGAGSGRRVR